MTVATIGEATGTTYAGQNDTYLTETSPTSNGNNSGGMFAQSPSAGNRRRGLLIFTGLSNIAPSVTVSGVDLKLRKDTTSATVNLSLYRILTPWTAAQTTWNLRSTGVNWASNGGFNATDIDTTPIATFSVAAGTDFITITGNSALNALVEGWINGTIPNYGFMLARDPDTAYDAATTTIRGGLDATSASRPLMTVTFTTVVPPTVTTNPNVSVVEGTTAVHTVTLSSTTASPTALAVTLAGSGANPATGGGVDFVSDLSTITYGASGVTHSGGVLTVPIGVLTFPIAVPTAGNSVDNASKTYTLTVGGVPSVGTITDNDAPPVVTFSDGVESFGVVTCVATLGAVSGKDVSFQVDTTNGTKTAGTNYTAIVAQTVTIPAGSLTAAITANTL